MLVLLLRATCFLAVGLLCWPVFGDETYSFFHEEVLGTSLEIRVVAENRAAAEQAETAVLDEIERLRRILSSYDPKSELCRWLRGDVSNERVSNDLYEVLRWSDVFYRSTKGAFDPRVEVASMLWKQCALQQRRPESEELREAVAQMRKPAWKLDAGQRTATRVEPIQVSFDALAKGYVVDSACRSASAQAGISGVLVNVGGDLKCVGQCQPTISIADPFHSAENEKPWTTISLKDHALATSGNYHRGYQIAGLHYSQIIDPRTAQPVSKVVSASVLASNTVTADALATAMSVMSVEESLALCETLENVECLLVLEDGQSFSSRGWPIPIRKLQKLTVATGKIAKSGELWNDPSKLIVEFEINRVGNEGRYRRPYLAMWIEDAESFPVRTLTLWLQTTQPGPRWHRDLRQWYKNDSMRKLVDGKNLIDSISAATKPPGKYKVVWDGKDDHGQPVKKGKYTFLLEVAREHGTYQIMKKEIEFDDQPIKEKLEGNIEIKDVLLEYRLGAP
jgi:FAD:protein FMN transferase